MPFFEAPASLRLRELASSTLDLYRHSSLQARSILSTTPSELQAPLIMAAANVTNTTLYLFGEPLPPHSQHPNFPHLAGLVSEAVLEVVFVALPGFLVAWTGMFDANSQKFVAELNTMVFTPCLIFTKLASQLNAERLADLVVIPFIFAAQTLVSYACAQLMARLWGFGQKKRQKNFILAMGVFGNSNSLPISLVLSLSKTIQGLHWDKIPGDNDNEVAARGILYLLIFQQLGQLLRWTWGYNVLLKPASAYDLEEDSPRAEQERLTEEGEYRDDPDDLIGDVEHAANGKPRKPADSGFGSASSSTPSPLSSSANSTVDEDVPNIIPSTAGNGNNISSEPRNFTPPQERPANGPLGDRSRSTGHITVFPNFSTTNASSKANGYYESTAASWKGRYHHARDVVRHRSKQTSDALSVRFHQQFSRLPKPLQRTFATMHSYHMAFWRGVWRQMNPPLWAMLTALIVASIPALQKAFFTPGTFVNNSITRAISQSGGVAVPLILVVLGANLARSTLPKDQLATSPEEKKEERRLLFASILSRMVLPTILMAPLLAVIAKYVPISILDDPIFIIVCFLLTGAPSALQLAQICQINNVFMGAMSNLLFSSYVVAIFPSTLTLILLALECLEWAQT